MITEIPSFCCDIALRRKSPALESLYMRRKALSREFSTRKTVGIAQNSLRSRSSAGIEGKMLSEILLTDRGSGKKWDFLRSCQSSQAILVITPELAAAPGRRSCRRPRPPAAYCARLTDPQPAARPHRLRPLTFCGFPLYFCTWIELLKGYIMAKSTIKPNHMSINWHDYTGHTEDEPITQASLTVKGSLIGRVGLMLLSCGTGAWRVRSSMNTMAEYLGVTCTTGIAYL